MTRATGLLALALLAPACALDVADSVTDIPTVTVASEVFRYEVSGEGNLEAAESTPLTAPVDMPTVMAVEWLAADGGLVAEGDVVVRFDATEMKLELLDGETQRDTATNSMVVQETLAEVLIRNLERDASVSQEELEAAQRFIELDPEYFSRIEIIESQIDESLATHKKTHALALRDLRQRLSQTELDLLSIDRRKAEVDISRAQSGLDAVEIRAPHDGMVLLERDWRGKKLRVGEQVWRGRQLAKIPNLSKMKAEVLVLEADAGSLAVGQPAELVIEAHGDVRYVARVSRVDTLAKPRLPDVPVQFFGVTLELEATDPAVMKPGQRVTARIVVVDREAAIAVPRQAVFALDGGRKVVYRWAEGRFEARDVTLGPSTLGRVIVEEGLAAGDRIALRDPSRSAAGSEAEESAAGAGPVTG